MAESWVTDATTGCNGFKGFNGWMLTLQVKRKDFPDSEILPTHPLTPSPSRPFFSSDIYHLTLVVRSHLTQTMFCILYV
ncbi:hypothetical protein [Microcoleus sp. herbarium12]|uniref:hypothetical protein n=1 Tax=Microcoleus sp. herbarium12 TaxID=3055437 RepID=UPI002FD72834